MKRFRLIAALVILCLMLSACDSLSLTGPDLLSPPRAQGDQARILSLIDESAGSDYTMIYPATGDYKSAVIFHDLDRDGKEEAAALYRGADGVSHILIAARNGDSYTAVGEGVINSSSVDRVDFCDLDRDGREELVTCYPDVSSPLSTVSVIHVDDAVTQTDMPTCCTSYLPGDYDGDGMQDLLLISLSSMITPASARLITYSEGSFGEMAACSMDDSVSELSRMTFGLISDDTVGAVIDCRNTAGEYTTQILYYDAASRSLLNPLFIYSGYQNTRRPTAIMSADVDRDNVIEIPICSMTDYADDEDVSAVCRKVTWNRYSPDAMTLVFKKTAILCDGMGFLLNLSDERTGNVTARYTGENSVTFYEWGFHGVRHEKGDELLTIRRYDKENYDSTRVIEAVLCETNTAVYTYTLTENEESYTADEVVAAFALTN